MRLWESDRHQDKMVDIFQRSCDGINTAVGVMQSMRITDVRQILDFISVHHVEVIVGLCFFLLMQFTKFTGVLLLAIAIAFGIFYMWDTYFPELSQRRSGNTVTTDYYNGRNVRDAQSSARLPPFINTSTNNSDQEVYGGNQKGLRNIATYTTFSSGQSSPHYSHNRMLPVVAPQVISSRGTEMSGANTPLGHLSSVSHQALAREARGGNRYEDRQYNRQSTYNESDHRSNRDTRQPPMYQDDNRYRRTRGSSINDDGRPTKSRRSTKDRPSSARRQYNNEQNENLRGHERKPYTTAAGPSTPSYRSTPPSSGNQFAKSAQYSTSSNRSHSERENQNQRNQRTPIQSGNNTPNRYKSSRRNSNQ